MTAAVRSGARYRPSRLQRWANTMLSRALRKGRGPRFMQLLSVRGRRSGVIRSTPVVPVQHGDHAWIVSPFGEVGWVRNARVAGRVELSRGDERTACRIRELDHEESLAVLRQYLSTPARFFAGRQIRDASQPHPVFELTPDR